REVLEGRAVHRAQRVRLAGGAAGEGGRLRLPARLHRPHAHVLARHEGATRGVHDALRLLSGRHRGDRVPDQSRSDRRRALPLPGAAPEDRRRRRLAGARGRARRLGRRPPYNTSVMDSLDLRLAPMAGVTNAPFRLVCRECGAGPLTSEEIDARALVEGNARTQVIAHCLPEERPIAFQLLGGDPDVLAEAARRLAATGADGIDLNMGCPVSKIVANGQGAALMRDPLRAAIIFRTLRKAVDVPFTIKIRSGWDERTVNAVEI